MSPRILVVDDDRAMVKTLCDILRLRGWDPHAAYSGTEAVSSMEEGHFPVVLMDIRMPGMDGVSAFKRIKSEFPEVRVILMTAFSSPELLGDAQREGALRVLPKPVDLHALLPLLQFGLRGSRPVMIVDDDPDFLRTLAASLEAHGFRVVTTDHREIVELIGEQVPVAIVLHLRLAHELARTAIQAIRELDGAVPLLVYSGHPPSIAEARNVLPGEWISAYLEKPLPFDQLSALLDSALAGSA
jgi:DNA-binding NtrC family response regulator